MMAQHLNSRQLGEWMAFCCVEQFCEPRMYPDPESNRLNLRAKLEGGLRAYRDAHNEKQGNR